MQIDLRRPGEFGSRETRIAASSGNISRLSTFAVEPDGCSGEFFDGLDHLAETHFRPSRNIEHRTWFHIGSGGGEVRFDNISDEGEVPHLRAVPVQREGPVVERSLDQTVHSHVRTLSRTVDGEVAKRHCRNAK